MKFFKTIDVTEEFRKLLAFFGVGLVATVVHLSVAGLIFVFDPIANPLVANFIAFLCAFPVSFWGHRLLTFKSSGNPKRFLILSDTVLL